MNAAVDPRLARRHGPWAVLTGASEGIGRAFTHPLAVEGLQRVLVQRFARRGVTVWSA